MIRSFKSGVAAACLLATPMLAHAGFGIDATRLIYPQGADSINVSVRNTETTTAYLVKATVGLSTSDAKSAPFDVTPPLMRLQPGGTNQLRVMTRSVAHLPADRESLFYFHTSAIPASQSQSADTQTEHSKGAIQFGVGNIIKMFYRPNGLPGSSVDAQRGLTFSRATHGLQVKNPSPYYVSLAGISVGGKAISLDKAADKTLAPFSTHVISTSGTQGEVKWKTISDEGGINEYRQKLP